MSSSSPRAGADLARAAPALQRGPLTWRRLEAALDWFWLMRERLQAPCTLALTEERLEAASIDGGRGGDITETVVTVSTIGAALRRLEREHPARHAILVGVHRDGHRLDDLCLRAKVSRSQAHIELGRAEAFLAGFLFNAGVLV